jgi:hypothetical protein
MTGAGHIARDINKHVEFQDEREILLTDLKNALAHVKKLSGLLPICAHCKKDWKLKSRITHSGGMIFEQQAH